MFAASSPHILDWSRSRVGRLSGLGSETGGHAARAGEITERLSREMASGTLPFMTMPYLEDLGHSLPKALERIAHCRHMLLLGIGGSALGARALQKAFCPGQDRPGYTGPWLWIADNVDADTLESWFTTLPPQETAVVVVSKSGGTLETLAQYFLAREWLCNALGDEWEKNVVIITDASKGYLREVALQNNMASLPVPDFLGGRFSALSAVGMLPAAFLGIDWKALMASAASMAAPLVKNPAGLGDHPAWDLAVWNRQLIENSYSQLIFFSYIPLWSFLGAWFAQLWAESLGKDGKGSMPLPAVGVTDQHSLQQMFLDGPKDKGCIFLHSPSLCKGRALGDDLPEQWNFLCNKRLGDLLEAEALGTRMALFQSKVPTVEMRLTASNESAAGKIMMLLEMMTLFTGWLLDIEPLDQPAVELGKHLANARLGAFGYGEENAALATFLSGKGKVSEF